MLYRKYRPKTFAEVSGQEHVVQTLQGALELKRIGHAYLFCGPRGTGKTTLARLFAKAINCQKLQDFDPCNKCDSCIEINEGKSLDLIEIDAASHTSVENVRDMIESAQVSSMGGRNKIFIIDETHMLSKSAFNALLKTLEEPPENVYFILATTEVHKVPETILSRVQRLDFYKIKKDAIIAKLRGEAKAEKIDIDDESLEMIAIFAGGSMRDAESALSKIISFAGSKITAEKTSDVLGIIPLHVHEEILNKILSKKPSDALEVISRLHESGANLEHFGRQFIDYLRSKLIETVQNNSGDPHVLARIIERFMTAHSDTGLSPIPQLPLELAIIDLAGSETAK